MRRTTIALALVVAALTGCGTGPPADAPSTVAAPSVAPSPRAVAAERACREAERIIIYSTARFNSEYGAAVAAGERGDDAAVARGLTGLRAAFRDWAAQLRRLAERTEDPALAALFTEYAGGVDATIARVKTASDLDRLYTFSEKELDIMADRFAHACG